MLFLAIVLVPSALFSVLIPVVLVGTRGVVKQHRQGIVRDLARVFDLQEAGGRGKSIPSFEFVKYKYLMEDSLKDDTAGGADQDCPRHRRRRESKDFPGWSWAVAALPLVATLFLASGFSFAVLAAALAPRFTTDPWVEALVFEKRHLWVWAFVAAFAGGYLFTIRSLFRAVNNFDLSPASFIGATNKLVFGVAIALLLAFGVLQVASGLTGQVAGLPVGDLSLSAVLLASFTVGFVPDPAMRALLRNKHLKYFKHDKPEVFKAFTATPVEVIDGIDTEIRDRLADYHIVSVQNLATANPIMLFVETPYGIYQIMDWVAQAQLCCSVGPDAVVELWKLGVRTIFDLERAVLDDHSTCELRRAVWAAMSEPSRRGGGGRDASPPVHAAGWPVQDHTIFADVCMRLDDPHVQRLRQIYIKVAAKLGDDSLRLPRLLARTGPCSGRGPCPVTEPCPVARRAPADAAG